MGAISPRIATVVFATTLLSGPAGAASVPSGLGIGGSLRGTVTLTGEGGSPYNPITKPQVKSQRPLGSKTLGTAPSPNIKSGVTSGPSPPPTVARPPQPPGFGNYQPPPPPPGIQAPSPPSGFQPPSVGGYQPLPPTGFQPPSLGGLQPPAWPRDQQVLPAPATAGTATPGTTASPPPPGVVAGAGPGPVLQPGPLPGSVIGGTSQSNGNVLPRPMPPPPGPPPVPSGTDVCSVRPDLCLAPPSAPNLGGGNNVGGTSGTTPGGQPGGGGGQTTVIVRDNYYPTPGIGVVIGVPTVEYVPQPVPVYPSAPPGEYSENQAIYGQPPAPVAPMVGAAAPGAPTVADPFDEVIARLKRLDEMRRAQLITTDDHSRQRQAILAALDAGLVSRSVGIEYGLRRLKGMNDDGTINAKEYEEKRKEFVLFL